MRVVAMTGGGRLGPAPILKMASGLAAHATLTKPITEEALKRRAIKVRTAMR